MTDLSCRLQHKSGGCDIRCKAAHDLCLISLTMRIDLCASPTAQRPGRAQLNGGKPMRSPEGWQVCPPARKGQIQVGRAVKIEFDTNLVSITIKSRPEMVCAYPNQPNNADCSLCILNGPATRTCPTRRRRSCEKTTGMAGLFTSADEADSSRQSRED